MMPKLRRLWIANDMKLGDPRSAGGLLLGCGVTAYDYDDAVRLLREHICKADPLPPIRRVIENVDVSALDRGHVLPNMGVPVWRGIWFPRGYEFLPPRYG